MFNFFGFIKDKLDQFTHPASMSFPVGEGLPQQQIQQANKVVRKPIVEPQQSLVDKFLEPDVMAQAKFESLALPYKVINKLPEQQRKDLTALRAETAGTIAASLIPGEAHLKEVAKLGEDVFKKLVTKYGDDVAKTFLKIGDRKIAEQALLKGGETVVQKTLLSQEASKAIAEGKTLEEFVAGYDIDNNSLKAYNKVYGTSQSNRIKTTPQGEEMGGAVSKGAVGDFPANRTPDFSGVADFVNKNPDGFTLNLNGKPLSSGFVVSPYKNRETILDIVDAESIQSFISKNLDILKQEGNHFGGWRNPSDGKFYLDVSVLKNTLDDAFHVAAQNNQLGIYDLKGGTTLNTTDVFKSKLTDIYNEANKGGAATLKNAEPLLNTAHFNIDKTAKDAISNTVESVKPQLEKVVGNTLTNKEVVDLANQSSDVLNRTVGREQTKQWEAQLLKLRQNIAAQAQNGVVDKEFIDNLVMLKSQATDIGRSLQSFSIGADPKLVTSKQALLESILKTGANADEIINAAKGVDFNDFNQAAKFYRQFVKPKTTEWIDLLRYNSMLSSPLTHIVNTTSNLLNTTIIAPIEKAIAGGVDFLRSTVTGKERKMFAGESGSFLQGYFTHIKDGFTNFSDVMAGKKAGTQLDIRNIPVATEGLKGRVANVLSYPLKLLEASDQFFTALTSAGEQAALKYRASKGIETALPEVVSEKKAAYRLYRQDLFDKSQGKALDAIDQFTSKIMSLRNNPNPIVSTISKFTVPFVKTPMNLFKQGLEYSPLGFTTLKGSPQKIEQLSKAILGSSIFAGATTLLLSNKITGTEPKGSAEQQRFRQAGRQAYSVKLGDKWVSYAKLPPAIAFPFAMVATIDDLIKNKTADDNTVDLILTGVAKYGQFLSDQSYAKSVGDLITAVQQGTSGVGKLISNYPQQLIPYRALSSWLARLIDDTQRQVDSKADFIDKQMQYLMTNIPGLSFKVAPRLDVNGQPIKQENVINAFSPARVSEENKQFEDFLNQYDKFSKQTKTYTDEKTKKKNDFKPQYQTIQDLIDAGKVTEARKKVNKLSDEEYQLYKDLKSTDKRRQTTEGEVKMFDVVQRVQDLVDQGQSEKAKSLVNDLSEEDYKYYRLAKKRLGF